jgi:hypothetical protein
MSLRYVSMALQPLRALGKDFLDGDQPVAMPLSTYTATQSQNKLILHASSGIRTHDSSVGWGEDGSCPRPRGHCDQHFSNMAYNVITMHSVMKHSPSSLFGSTGNGDVRVDGLSFVYYILL